MATQQSRYMIVTGLVVLTLFVYLIYLTNDIMVPAKVHTSPVSFDHKVNKPETAKLINSDDKNIKHLNDLSERLNSSSSQFSYNVMPSEIVKALNVTGGKNTNQKILKNINFKYFLFSTWSTKYFISIINSTNKYNNCRHIKGYTYG